MTNCTPTPAKMTITIHAKNAFKARSWRCAEMPETDNIFKPLRPTFEQKKAFVFATFKNTISKIKLDYTNIEKAVTAAGYKWYEEKTDDLGWTFIGYAKKSVWVCVRKSSISNCLHFKYVYSMNTGRKSKAISRMYNEQEALEKALFKAHGFNAKIHDAYGMWNFMRRDDNSYNLDDYFTEDRVNELYKLIA